MRLRLALRALSMVVAGMALLWTGSAGAHATGAGLSATINSTNPTRSSLTLKNISDHACQVATTAEGTVAITQVMQQGKTVQPLIADSASDEDVGYLLQDQLKTLQPGQSTDITLATYKLSSGYILRATTWSSDGGSFTTEYPIVANKPLQLNLNYSLPITPAKGAPACAAVSASSISSGRPLWLTVIVIGAAILVIAAIVLFVMWLWRKKKHHRKTATIAVFVLLGLGAWWYQAPAAHADVVVPPDLQSTYNACIAVFNANRDITGPVLDALNNPNNHYEIVHRTSAGSDMTGRPNDHGGGDFRIYWNPNDHHPYAGTGGSPDPCTSLYHELFHAFDMLRGTFSRDDCAGSGIETKEVEATRAQNLLRARLGFPVRSHYGNLPLPSGDCRGGGARHTSCTGAHCAEDTGDPHLYTFDGLRYDFQAAGEFTAVRNQSGSFEIQARQEPWTNSRLVSVNTAIAFKIGGDKVELRSGQTVTLLVNGKKQRLETAKLPGGGQFDYTQNVAQLTWPDGSLAYVQAIGSAGLTLSVQLSDEQAGHVEGLLGNADGNETNDLHVKGSTQTIKPTFAQLYPKFADSWRITDKTSLFTYGEGKSTKSYTIASFPDNPENPRSLPGYAAAEAYCKNMGISDPAVLANCALDMAITGRPEFAKAAVRSQAFTAGANFNGTTWQLHIANPGDSATVTFDGKANEKIFIMVPKTTLPSQCGGLRLLKADGTELANGCIINGAGYIDGTVLPADSTYTLSLTPNGPTGDASVRLLRITDKQGAIVPDGPPVTVNIDQPGVVARYTFSASAGQRVYVAIPSSTLPSQCGIIRVLAPDGHEVGSGCIVNHTGNVDTLVLPDTGQYTVVVDPTDTATGQAQLQLILPTADNKSITIDGPTLSANLKNPGSIATFTFDGTAGQRIFVDIPSTELPSQCGLLTLKAPDGGVLASGCVINHKGNIADDGTVLPASGQYTITIDPGAGDTGATTIRVRSR